VGLGKRRTSDADETQLGFRVNDHETERRPRRCEADTENQARGEGGHEGKSIVLIGKKKKHSLQRKHQARGEQVEDSRPGGKGGTNTKHPKKLGKNEIVRGKCSGQAS